MTVRIFNELRGRMDALGGEKINKEALCIKKDTETIKKKNPGELKNTVAEIKNMLEGINIVLDKAEDQIRNLEDRVAESTQSEKQKEFLKHDDILRITSSTMTSSS